MHWEQAGPCKLLVSVARSKSLVGRREERESTRDGHYEPQSRASQSKWDGPCSSSLPSGLCSQIPGPSPLRTPCLLVSSRLGTPPGEGPGALPSPGWILGASSQDMPMGNETNNKLAVSAKGTWRTWVGARKLISCCVCPFAIL